VRRRRKGIGGGSRPGGFGPVVEGAILLDHPLDPEAWAISKNKPLIVGSNRDETVFLKSLIYMHLRHW